VGDTETEEAATLPELDVQTRTLHEGVVGDVHFDPYLERRAFDAELMDKNNYGKTAVRTKETSIRVYPREETGLEQSIQIYNFVDDHIDPNCKAIEVV
jgi:hypothetical protein